jgi:hypothetical protein
MKIPIQKQSDNPKSIRRIDKYTISDFTFKLSSESWDRFFSNENVNLMINSFLNIYLRIFDSSFPLISKISGIQKSLWITLGIITSCKRKRELFLTLKNRNDLALKQYYKAYCKILVKVINKAKRMTFNKRISKSNNKTKTTWDIINELSGKHHSTQDIRKLSVEGNYVTNQSNIPDALNKYFSTITEKANNIILGNTRQKKSFIYSYLDQIVGVSYPPMVFKAFSTYEIISMIKSLKTKHSHGYDGISTKLLKISDRYICCHLTHICNKSFSTGTFPERLKYSITKPLYKKGDKTDPSNY